MKPTVIKPTSKAWPVRNAARAYIRRGYSPIPVPNRKKGPKLPGWQNLQIDEQQVEEYFRDAGNMGLLLGEPSGGLIDVDLDSPETLAIADDFLPPTKLIHGRNSKRASHRWYQVANIPAPMKLVDVDGTCLLEIRSTGQQTIVPPSVHPSGEILRWEQKGLPAKVKTDDLIGSAKLLAASSIVARHWPARGSRNEAAMALAGTLLRAGWSLEATADFIAATARAAGDEEWRSRGAATSSTEAKLANNDEVTGATRLRELIGDAVVDKMLDWLEISAGNNNKNDSETEHLTDLGNAGRFVAQHGNDVRYCHISGKWLVWDGIHWCVDENGEVERRAKTTVRNLYEQASREMDDEWRQKLGKWAQASESRGRIAAMIDLAKSEPKIPVSPPELDANPWLLNCANGTIDLRTGELRKHRAEDFCTKIVATAYDPDAECPRFKKFLRDIFAGNLSLIRFLQRAVGYSLTGSTQEQVIFIFWGSGSNGKTTLIDVLCLCLGDYARTADSSLLMARKYDGIRNDVARLAGARFVSAAETEAGRQLAENLVKQLTGGDKIAARYFYSEFFEFIAQFKLFLATNHRPAIKGTDHAIWRRIRLVPFEVTIPPEEQDKNLPEKLRAELPGILAWAVRGCLGWQQDGLGQPPEITRATANYRQEMDTFGGFLRDRCVVDEESRVATGDLYRTYKTWCESTGEKPLTQQKLAIVLVDRGFSRWRKRLRPWLVGP